MFILNKNLKIAVFITSHGFGHGTRACAVLNQITKSRTCEFDIFSTLPNWFFYQNLPNLKLNLHPTQTDVGLVQKNPFVHDLLASLNQLKEFTQFNNSSFLKSLKIVQNKKFDLIISDISPLGLEIGNQTGIPSILIENFTWDWIYQQHCKTYPAFNKIIEILKKSFSYADLHIQTTPFCKAMELATQTLPVARKVKKSANEIRYDFGLKEDAKLILLTTGGITQKLKLNECIQKEKDITFLTTTESKSITHNQNIISIPLNSNVHYPDLVNTANLVVGKVGYGTLAECWSTDTPLLGCYRSDFRESQVLLNFATEKLEHEEITVKEFEEMSWIHQARELMKGTTHEKSPPDRTGVSVASEAIIRLVA